jgi:hypothetical protein
VERVQELTKQLEEKNESIAALQKQVRACMVAMRGCSVVQCAGDENAGPGPGQVAVSSSRPAEVQGGPTLEQLKRSFKEDTQEMKQDFERIVQKLRDVRCSCRPCCHTRFGCRPMAPCTVHDCAKTCSVRVAAASGAP